MSKKHFIALADTLRLNKPFCAGTQAPELAALEQWQSDVNAIADFCKSQNGQFNRERWLDYIAGKCGPNGGTIRKAA